MPCIISFDLFSPELSRPQDGFTFLLGHFKNVVFLAQIKPDEFYFFHMQHLVFAFFEGMQVTAAHIPKFYGR